MKKSDKKTFTNLENQKVDSDKIVGGRKHTMEGFVRGNDKFAASKTQSDEKPGETKLSNSVKSKFNQQGKF